METGNKGAVAAVNEEFWYTIKLVLSQCKFTAFSIEER